jgi:hypothetical protein
LIASSGLAPVYAAPTVGGDESGPQVQILQPGYQDVLKGKTKISIAVKTKKFNPQFVEMFIDDKPATSGPISITAVPSAQYDWDTKLFTDGPHKLTVRITDTQGFRGWAEVNVYINNNKKVDSLPPSLAWQNIASYQQLSGKSQIQLQAVDNFGVKWIIVSVNPASEPNRKPALRSWLLNRPPYVVNFDTSGVADGLYQMTAKAWDSFDQEGVADPLTLGIVNSGTVNATTIGEMLDGMRKMDSAKPKAASAKATPKFTVDVPADGADSNSSSAAANIYTQRTPESKTPVSSKVVVKAGAAAPKTQLQPSAPAMIVQSGKSAAKLPVQVAKNTETPLEDVASPRLSGNATVAAPGTPSALSSEIDGAVADDWRGRIARLAVPGGAARSHVAEGQLSAPRGSASRSEELGVSRLGSAPLDAEPSRNSAARLAVPIGAERAFSSDASQNPQNEKPVLSQNKVGSLRLAANDPLTLEAASGHTGRLSNPTRLAARPQVGSHSGPSVSAPAFSSKAPHNLARVAPRLAGVPAVLSDKTGRLSSPTADSQRSFEGAQFSASPTAPRTQLSAKVPTSAEVASAQIAAPQTVRAGKTASPDKNRIAALPRFEKNAPRSAINAITVSPLEIKTSDAIPAFHVVARSSDLRAVAARYGLPVAVVAACNSWPATKTLVAGEKVKLPHQLKVSYQGVPVQSDAPSMLVGGTGVTAFRFLFQQAGGKLEWDGKKQRVIAKKGNSEVVLTIGSKKAKVGDKDVMMELAAFLFEGRTMVPVRFFEEGLRAEVEWDPQTGRLVVAMAN